MLGKIGEAIAKLKTSDEEKAICSSFPQQPINASYPPTSFQSDNEKAICSCFSQQSQPVSYPSTSFKSVEDKTIYLLSQQPNNISQLSTNSQYTVFDLDSRNYSFNL